ncbi:metal-dependent hydrolase [Chloroflexota bacterium]
MLPFGHMGITLAAGMLTKGILLKSPVQKAEAKEMVISSEISSSFALIKNHVDYRLLLVGSLLPDLIDKPLGDIFFYSIFRNGRIFSHTLCLNITLAALGVYISKRWNKTWLLILSFGAILHLILDQMWLQPQTFLWPLYGWNFAKADSVNFLGWLPTMFQLLTTEATVYVPELVGLSILAWFAARLIQRRQVYAFIRKGVM